MKALPIIILLLIANLPSVAAAEPGTEEFKFEQTIAIYHMVHDGGIIYVRPDKYDENQGFIKIYEALDQYLAELRQSERETFFPPTDLPLTVELILVNGVTEKQYFLKEGWLGDSENWVPMNEQDYQTLLNLATKRQSVAGSATSAAELAAFTAMLRDANQNGIPDFEAQFGSRRNQQNLTEVSASEDTTTINNDNHIERHDDLPGSSSSPIHDNVPQVEETVRPAGVEHAKTAFTNKTAKLSPEKQIIGEDSDQSAPADAGISAENSQPSRTWQTLFLILLVGWLLYFLQKRIRPN